jgi:hypothetical protein
LALIFFVQNDGNIETVKLPKTTVVFNDSENKLIYKGISFDKIRDKYYVLDKDDWNIKIFDRKFNIIKTIKITKGEGPTALNFITNISIDNDLLYVVGVNKLLCFNSEGEFVKKNVLPMPIISGFAVKDNKLYTWGIAEQLEKVQGFGGKDNSNCFVVLDLNSMERKYFGNIDYDILPDDESDLAFYEFTVSGNKLFINMRFIPKVFIYDLNTLKKIKSIVIADYPKYRIFSKIIKGPYGNFYISTINNAEKKAEIFVFDGKFKQMLVYTIEEKMFPLNFIVENDMSIYMLTDEGTKIEKSRLSAKTVVNSEKKFLKYLKANLKNSEFEVKSIAKSLLEQFEILNIDSEVFTAKQFSLDVVGFDRDKVVFSGGETTPSLFVYDIDIQKFKLITKSSFDGGFCNFQFKNNFYVLEYGNTKSKKKYIYELNNDGKIKSKIPLDSKSIPKYCINLNHIVLKNRKKIEYSVFVNGKYKIMLSNSELLSRNIGYNKYTYEKFDYQEGFYWVFFEKECYYFCINSNMEIVREGLIFDNTKKNRELMDVCVSQNKNILFVVKDRDTLQLYEKNIKSQNNTLLLNIPMPVSFQAYLNRHGDVLVYFYDSVDYLIYISKKTNNGVSQ